MITFFTLPKAFKGHINIIQRNAIQSWRALVPECEIILLGEEEGIKEVAKELQVFHVSNIQKNEWGTPLLDSAFNLTQKIAKNDTLVYINTDIILMPDFLDAIQRIDKPLFLMGGRRWDLDIKEEINFKESDWGEKLRQKIQKESKLHGFSGIDYLVFPRNLPHNLPAFAVGRPGWDNWLIYHISSLKIPVIDATGLITCVHQNHGYSHSPWGRKKRVEGPEYQRNLKLAGGLSRMLTLLDADWILTPQGLKKTSFPRCIFPLLSRFSPWRLLLSIKRRM